MAGFSWTEEELDILTKLGPNTSCKIIAEKIGRTTKSVRHKFNQLGIKKDSFKVGDIVKTWEIIELYEIKDNSQRRTMAKIKSTVDDQIRSIRLTALHQGKVVDQNNDGRGGLNKTHNMSKSSLYIKYNSMHDRCYNPKSESYHNYGERGIEVCEEWHTFENYMKWCVDNGWYEGFKLQLDRIDNNQGYSPENCRFVTRKENNNNRQNTLMLTAFGETKAIMYWAEDERCKCTYEAMYSRIYNGWNHERAISTPKMR